MDCSNENGVNANMSINIDNPINLEKKKKRLENQKIYCYNMQKFNKGNFTKQGDEFLTNYFTNLCNFSEEIKKYYFGKSTGTFSNLEKDIYKNYTYQGVEDIYSNLLCLKDIKTYEIKEKIIQPMIGQGLFISLKALFNNNVNKISMVFNLILIKKELHVLNQYINIE